MEDRKRHQFKFREEYDRKYNPEKAPGVITERGLGSEISADTNIVDEGDVFQQETDRQYYMCRYFAPYCNETDKYRCNSPGKEGRCFFQRRGTSEEAVRFQTQCSKCNANGIPKNCKFYAEYITQPETVHDSSLKEEIGVIMDFVKEPIGTVVKTFIDEMLK